MSISNRLMMREIHEMVGGADEEGTNEDQTYRLGHDCLHRGYVALAKIVRIKDLDDLLGRRMLVETNVADALRDVVGDTLYRVQWKQKKHDKPILVSVARSVYEMYASLDE